MVGKVSNGMTWLYRTTVWCFFFTIIALLTFYCGVCTCTISIDESEITFFVQDSVWKNVLSASTVLLAVFAFKKIGCTARWADRINRNEIRFHTWKKVLLYTILAMGLIWAFAYQGAPIADQSIIQKTVTAFRRGDYSALLREGYMERYPHQFGLVWVYYLFSFVFGCQNYIYIQILNALALAWVYKEMVDLLDYWGMKPTQQLMMLLCGILFFPLIMYCSFAYGNILGLAFSVAAIRQEMLYFHKEQKRNAILSAFFISLGMMVKSNYQIFLIGMVLYGIIKMLQIRRWKLLLFPGLLVLGYAAQKSIPIAVARSISGLPIDQGCSMWSWIAMGLQDGELAPGWFNGYVLDSYKRSGFQKEVHQQIAMESIRRSLLGFMENKWQIISFFSKKNASQWCNPNFQAFNINQDRITTVQPANWLWKLLTINGVEVANVLLDPFEFIIFTGAMLNCLFGLREKKTDESYVFPMIFVGGFLFHTIWEAKGQYTLPFFVLLFPYAICGYSDTVDRLQNGIHIRGWKNSSRMQKMAGLYVLCVAVSLAVLYGGDRVSYLTGDTAAYAEYVMEMDSTPRLQNGVYYIHNGNGAYLTYSGDTVIAGNQMKQPITLLNYQGTVTLRNQESSALLAYSPEKEAVLPLESLNWEYQFKWTLKPHTSGGFCLLQKGQALTALENGTVSLEAWEEERQENGQIWFFEKQ